MSVKQFVSEVLTLHDHHWVTQQVVELQLRIDRTRERLTTIAQHSLLRQHQLQQIKVRMNQLEEKLKQPGSGPPNPVEQSPEPEAPNDADQSQLIQELHQQIQQRSGLLRRSAHDLRSNFGVIGATAHLLNQTQTEQQRKESLDMLQRNVRQATQLIIELLDVTRLEAGQERRQLTTFNVAELLDGLIETLRPLTRDRGLWLRKQAGADLILVEGDPVKLYRIVQNLVLNALTYTQEGGVTLTWKTQADKWQLTITDTGPGLPAAVQRSSSGEGIGLLIVRELCKLLDGQFLIEKPKRTGTRFKLLFPRRYLTVEYL